MDDTWFAHRNSPLLSPRAPTAFQNPTVPLPILGHGAQADGIGSPTDLAYTPPGVLTKFDTITKAKLLLPLRMDKMVCANCAKKAQCFCKKCTLENLRMYSKRENFYNRKTEKERLQREINGALSEASQISAQENVVRESIAKMRKQIALKQLMLEEKRKELDESELKTSRWAETYGMFKNLLNKHKASRDNLQVIMERWKADWDAKELELMRSRQNMCMMACYMFPIKEFEVKIVEQGHPIEQKVVSKGSKETWTMVSGGIAVGRRYQVRSAYLNESLRAELMKALGSGAYLSLPRELHPPFAAIAYTFQLVQLFLYIFNLSPPFEISQRELCTRTSWSKEIIEQHWQKLCDAVYWLCIHVGMDGNTLDPAQPHSNLMAFAAFVADLHNDIKGIERLPYNYVTGMRLPLSLQHQTDQLQIPQEEEDEWLIVDA